MFRRFLVPIGAAAGSAAAVSYLHDRYTAQAEPMTEVQSTSYQYALTSEQKKEIAKFQRSLKKPMVVSLYDKEDGTTYADLAVEHLQNKGIEVVLVSSQEGLDHPVFKEPANISGIYLPGGPDIPVSDSANTRMKFEAQLINIAEQSDIPLLGICRGQQAIGYHHGMSLQSLTDDQHEVHYGNYGQVYEETENPNLNNKVRVKSGSQLHHALRYKLNNSGSENESIDYSVTCLHQQHLINETGHVNSPITVTGMSACDGHVESIEKKTGKYYTYGLQHHPEAVINAAIEDRKMKLDDLQERVMDSLIFDPEVSIHLTLTEKAKIFKRSNDEIAARAELGLFTHQTKRKFLEHQQQVVSKKETVITVRPSIQL
jgi:gamma-glutamyl-gamma-aminobutyrate hydrolase PuuD